jgi:DNA-binding LacI/PurR family transcriptional regulator
MALYTELIKHFRDRILDGSLPAGARLPPELALAEEYQISRGTVRQALIALVNEGLIERVQGRGTFVRPIAPPNTVSSVRTEKRLGLVLNRLGAQLDLDILVGAEQAAKSRGYQISFAYTEDNLEQQARDIERLLADRVAGMIIFPVHEAIYDQSIWHLQASGVPFVLVDRYFLDLDTDYVVADNFGGGYRATEHLLLLGHTRISFVYTTVDTLHTTSVRDRWLGYKQALHAYDIPYDETLLFQKPAVQAGAQHPYDAFLSSPDRSSAIFAVHDGEALDLLRAAHRCKLRVPEDLALVGFDDLSYAAHLDPPLTTVAQPRMELGLRAGNLLINRIEGHQGPPQHVELPTTLVVRVSCGGRMRVRQWQSQL